MNILNKDAIIKQSARPSAVGIRNARAVRRRLFVSLYIVIREVEQGKWKSANIAVQAAVTAPHPFATKSSQRPAALTSVPIEVAEEYITTSIGITISFAGIPSKKARITAPSIPKMRPNGSKNSDTCARILIPSISRAAKSHMTAPIGAATKAARKSTEVHLSHRA